MHYVCIRKYACLAPVCRASYTRDTYVSLIKIYNIQWLFSAVSLAKK